MMMICAFPNGKGVEALECHNTLQGVLIWDSMHIKPRRLFLEVNVITMARIFMPLGVVGYVSRLRS